MKIFYGGKIAVLLLLLQLSGAGALRSEAAEMKLWKFPQEPVPVRLNRGDERGQKLEFTPEGLRLSWDAEKFIYAELLTEKMPEIEAFEKAEFKASVRSSGACPVRIFNLRLIDATGENFQWNSQVEWSKAGDYVVSYQVTPENADLHWGGNNDKKIDFPAKFAGFSVDFLRGSGKGSVVITGAEVRSDDGSSGLIHAEEKLILADFSGDGASSPALNLNRGDERGQSLRREKEGLVITWDGTKHPYFEWNLKEALPLPQFTSGTVRVKLNATDAASVWRFNLRMIDAANETLQWEEKVDWTAPGEKELVFNIAPTNCSQSWGGKVDGKITFPVRFLGVSADFKPGSGTGSVTIESIDGTFQTESKITEAVDVSVETGHPLALLTPDRAESELKILLRNRVNAEIPLQLELFFRDFSGRELRETRQLTLKPQESRSLKPETKLDRRGIWYVTMRLSSPGDAENYRDVSTSIAVMEPAGPTPGPTDGFLFGICSHPNWTDDRSIYEREALAMALCGAKVLRMDLEWWDIERTEGSEDYAKYDTIVNVFAEQGIELEAILGKPPKWATTEGNLPEYGAWRRHVRSLLKHYRGKIRYWEVWNEPDLIGFATFGVPEYIELMRIVREEAGKVDPDAVILSGGFATMSAHGSKKANFQEDTLAGSRGLFDVHAYHEHGGFAHYRQQVDDAFLPMRNRLKIDAPWYANETALTSAGSGERLQAETLFKKFLFAWARGSIGYNWYNLRNKGYDPQDGEHNYGLLTRDFHPKAAYVVYNTLATLFKGGEFVRRLETGDGGVWILEFRNPRTGKRILALWREDFNRRGESRFLLKCAAPEAARAVDLMGNTKTLPVVGDFAVISAGREPGMVVLNRDESPELQPALLTMEETALLVPNRSVPLKVTFQNPLPEESRFSYELRLPRAVSLREVPEEGEVRLAPGGKAVCVFALEVNDDFTPDFGEAVPLEIDYVLNDGAYQDTQLLPLHGAMVLPAQFVLREKSQTVSLFDADPTRTSMVWRNADDLSAAARLDCRDGKLLLDVDVTDDRHVQMETGADVWKGDNVQIAMQLPGQSGMWEIGLTLLENGAPECFVWMAPRNFNGNELASAMKLDAKRDGRLTRYRAEIPMAALGLTGEMAAEGFRFNLLVNDNDGEGRKGWIHIAPGIGRNKDSDQFPFVMKLN